MRSDDLLAYLSLTFKWLYFMFLMQFCSNLAQKSHFSEIRPMCDRPTDGPTLLSTYEDATKTHPSSLREIWSRWWDICRVWWGKGFWARFRRRRTWKRRSSASAERSAEDDARNRTPAAKDDNLSVYGAIGVMGWMRWRAESIIILEPRKRD